MSKSHDAFIDSLRNVEVLTAADEILLARRIAKGGKDGARAREKMILHNLKLVAKVANGIARARHLHLLAVDDLFQAGCIGLYRAVDKFDPERGYKFSTYAYWWIRQAITREIEGVDHSIRLTSTSLRWVYYCINLYRTNNSLQQSVDQTCTDLKINRDTLVDALSAYTGSRSLSELTTDDTCLVDVIGSNDDPAAAVELEDQRAIVRSYLERLRPEDAAALKATYGIGTDEVPTRAYAQQVGLNKHQAQLRVERGRAELKRLLSQAKLFSIVS